MSKIYIVLILILCCSVNSVAKEIIPYFTIGIRIGWDSKCGRSISSRVSLGVIDIDESAFINLTFGVRKFMKPIIGVGECAFLDIQAGNAFEKFPGIFFGGGAGLLFCKSPEGIKIVPRNTIFAGCFLFPSIDVTYWKRSKISYDAGLEVVLPIPLGGIDIGSIGGD